MTENNIYRPNEDDLSGDLVEQGVLINTHMVNYAEAKNEYRQTKNEITVREAELTLDVNANFSAYLFDKKPTADQTKAAVNKHEDMLALRSRLNKSLYEMDLHDASVKGLEAKGYSLKSLLEIKAMEQRN